MQLDRLALRLRRRRPWEALDLGCRMVQTWWRPVMAAWLTVYVPAAVAVYFVFREHLVIAMLVMWWLKPLFDRIALEVLSKAVFGAPPGPVAALRSLRDSPGIVASLTIYRFDLARSFNMPISHLERLKGRVARERSRSLSRRDRGPAVWATIVYFNFELVLTLAFFGAIDLFTPAEYDAAFGLKTLLWNENAPAWRQVLAGALQVATVSLLEPFYVASGFALYLNRRMHLEAWDLELTLRSIARADSQSRARAIAASLFAAFVLAFAAAPDARAAGGDAEKAIRQVLTAPEFEQYRETKRYRFRGSEDRDDHADTSASSIGDAIAVVARVLMWIGALFIVGLLLYYARRYIAAWAPETATRKAAPSVLFGLDVTPESLPDDVAAAVLAEIERGRAREALGLMYRAALSALVTRDGVGLEAGDTEGDCVRRAAARVDAAKAQVFADLVRAWQATAYARRPPHDAELRSLLDAWRGHFDTAAR